MRGRSLMIISICYLLLVSFTDGHTWAQAWVDEKIMDIDGLSPVVKKSLKHQSVQVVLLTKKDMVTRPSNKNTYLRCYIINNTDTITSIKRADATIADFSSQIYKDGKWLPFQVPIRVSCGNSYWTQKLKQKEVLSVEYDHSENGPVNVPFRIAFNHGNGVLYSNKINIDIDQTNYDRVGKK